MLGYREIRKINIKEKYQSKYQSKSKTKYCENTVFDF